jgi:hypothetical protein
MHLVINFPLDFPNAVLLPWFVLGLLVMWSVSLNISSIYLVWFNSFFVVLSLRILRIVSHLVSVLTVLYLVYLCWVFIRKWGASEFFLVSLGTTGNTSNKLRPVDGLTSLATSRYYLINLLFETFLFFKKSFLEDVAFSNEIWIFGLHLDMQIGQVHL